MEAKYLGRRCCLRKKKNGVSFERNFIKTSKLPQLGSRWVFFKALWKCDVHAYVCLLWWMVCCFAMLDHYWCFEMMIYRSWVLCGNLISMMMSLICLLTLILMIHDGLWLFLNLKDVNFGLEVLLWIFNEIQDVVSDLYVIGCFCVLSCFWTFALHLWTS